MAGVLQWPVHAPAVLWTTGATAHSWLCTEVDQEGFEGSVLVTGWLLEPAVRSTPAVFSNMGPSFLS